MAKILNWARLIIYIRPNDLEEGPMLIIIPKIIRINYNFLEVSRKFFLILILLDLIIICFKQTFIWSKILFYHLKKIRILSSVRIPQIKLIKDRILYEENALIQVVAKRQVCRHATDPVASRQTLSRRDRVDPWRQRVVLFLIKFCIFPDYFHYKQGPELLFSDHQLSSSILSILSLSNIAYSFSLFLNQPFYKQYSAFTRLRITQPSSKLPSPQTCKV